MRTVSWFRRSKWDPPQWGVCCNCGYGGAYEFCEGWDDEMHCVHWWETAESVAGWGLDDIK